MPIEETQQLYDLLVLLLLLAIPFALAGLWVAYRLVRGHRWRQKELLHTSIAILNTNQAILSLLLRVLPPEKQGPRPGVLGARKRRIAREKDAKPSPEEAALEAPAEKGSETPPSA
jgi:hypothetical protein